jgi:hypothetical protein
VLLVLLLRCLLGLVVLSATADQCRAEGQQNEREDGAAELMDHRYVLLGRTVEWV